MQGAGSPIIAEGVGRITAALTSTTAVNNPDTRAACVRKSFILSVDQAHAIHPNYGMCY